MYKYTDFDTIKELPDTVKASELAEAMGISLARVYDYIEVKKMPYVLINRRKVLFKEHILQNLDGYTEYTEISKLKAINDLPKVFNPMKMREALRISAAFAYDLTRYPGFPAVCPRNRVVVNKQGFITWIEDHMKNFKRK